jgi:hypothetical protein
MDKANREIEVVEHLIHEVRGRKVMIDADLARLYGVGTKVLNQAVKRNRERFPADFMFPLESGLCAEPPFNGQRSWAKRMIRLRDGRAPFRLAYLEVVPRSADMRTAACCGAGA